MDINYNTNNQNIIKEIESALSKGAELIAGNHYALRNALLYKNEKAINHLQNYYKKSKLATNSYRTLIIEIKKSQEIRSS